MAMERVLWFDGRIRAGSHPSSADLAERFKVSLRTAQRDIEFLRDRLRAPLRYEPAAKGYAYGDPGFLLPQAFFRKDEMIALLFARRLFREIKPPMGDEAAAVFARLDELFKAAALENAEDAVSFDVGKGSETSGKVFFDLLRAITRRSAVTLQFDPAPKSGSGAAEIEPLRLHFTHGAWHVAGISRRRGDACHYPLSRIRRVEVTGRRFLPPKDRHGAGVPVRKWIRGGKVRDVRIRFGSRKASWGSAQEWHPDQRVQLELDGSAVLELPEARVLQVIGLALLHGGEFEVAAPRELRDAVGMEIDRLTALYTAR
jgi:predicted DNA-binding transcriptional regulator YafY